MVYIPTTPTPQHSGDDEGFVADIMKGVRSIPHLPNALLHGPNEEGISPEESDMRKRALSEAATWVIPALVTPAAGLLMKGAPVMVRAILAGAAGFGAGEGARAAVQGEDVAPSAIKGALLGGAFGAAGGLLEQGAVRATQIAGGESEAMRLAEESIAKKLSAQKSSELSQRARQMYKDGLGQDLEPAQIIERLKLDPDLGQLAPDVLQKMLGPNAGKPLQRPALTRPGSPASESGVLAQRAQAGSRVDTAHGVALVEDSARSAAQARWVRDTYKKAAVAGLGVEDILDLAGQKNIPADTALKALGVPQGKWSLYAPFATPETKAAATVLEQHGITPDASIINDAIPPGLSRMRSPLGSSIKYTASIPSTFGPTQTLEMTDTAAKRAVLTGTMLQAGTVAPANSPIHWFQDTERFASASSPLRTQEWAILTAENPGAQAFDAATNTARNEHLVKSLKAAGYDPIPVTGHYGGNPENSFVIPGMKQDEALRFGKRYGQQAVLIPKGMLNADGTLHPANLEKINFAGDQADFFTSIKVDGKDVKFAIPIDFDKKVSAKSILDPIKSAIGQVTQSRVFEDASMLLHRAFAPSRATLAKLGGAGVELAEKMDSVFSVWRQQGGREIAGIRAILSPFNSQDRIHIGEIMEGLAVPRDERLRAAADQLSTLYEGFATEAKTLGIQQLLDDGTVRGFKGRMNYLTHYYDEKAVKRYMTEGTPEFERALQFLRENGQAVKRDEAKKLIQRWLTAPSEFRTGPINFSRTRMLQDVAYEKDPLKVMSRYIYSVRKRLEIAREFGHDNRGVLDFYRRIGEDGGQAQVAKNIFDAFSDNLPKDYMSLVKATSTYNVLTMLNTAGIVQPAQLLNTASRVGYVNTIRALGALHSKAAREWTVSTGAHLNEVLQEMMGTSSNDLAQFWVQKVIGLEPLDKANRMVSALAGRFYAEEVAAKFAAKQLPKHAAELEKLGIRPTDVLAQAGKLTDDQIRRAGFKVSTETQFASQVLDLPELKNSLAGQFVYQFKSFALQQTYFLDKELLRPARDYFVSGGKRGAIAPLLRYAAGLGPTGYMIGNLVRTIKGRPAPDDPNVKMMENLAMVGAFGVFYDTWKAMDNGPGGVLSMLTGPTSGEMANYLGRDIPNAIKGDPKALAKHVVSRVPLIGQPLANYWLFPPD